MTGHPPIYVGLYIDDLIYFSAGEQAKMEFQRRIKDDQKIPVDFEGEPKKFLGMKWQKSSDNESITIHLQKEATTSALVE